MTTSCYDKIVHGRLNVGGREQNLRKPVSLATERKESGKYGIPGLPPAQ